MYNTMANHEREEKGSQMRANAMPKTDQNGTKRVPKWKKVPPNASFVEQERKQLEKGCEKDDNVCQNGTLIDATSQQKSSKQKKGNEQTRENH